MGAKGPDQCVDVGRRQDLWQRARHSHQRHHCRAAPTTTGGEPPWHRVRSHRRVVSSHQVGVEAGDRRQATGNRAGRQSRFSIGDPHHPPVAPLMGQEVEHITSHDGDRILLDHAEERLQIEGDSPQSVGSDPTRHELEIAVNEWMTEEISILTGWRLGTNKGREGGHPGTLAAVRERHGDAPRITRVLSVRGDPRPSMTLAVFGDNAGGVVGYPASAS